MTFYKYICPVLEQNIKLICPFYTWMIKFLKALILIDLQKAFDTIDHNILVEKVKAICFYGDTANWFHSYLSDLAFLVSIEKHFMWCAQGSIHGPLLFLIHFSDMIYIYKWHDMIYAFSSDLLLYADGSCLAFNKNMSPKLKQT